MELATLALTPGQEDVAVSLNSLATTISGLVSLLDETENYKDVLPIYERAVATIEASLGSEHINVAHNLRTRAGFYRRLKRYDEAAGLLQRALSIQRNALPSESKILAETQNDLSRVLDDLERQRKGLSQ